MLCHCTHISMPRCQVRKTSKMAMMNQPVQQVRMRKEVGLFRAIAAACTSSFPASNKRNPLVKDLDTFETGKLQVHSL